MTRCKTLTTEWRNEWIKESCEWLCVRSEWLCEVVKDCCKEWVIMCKLWVSKVWRSELYTVACLCRSGATRHFDFLLTLRETTNITKQAFISAHRNLLYILSISWQSLFSHFHDRTWPIRQLHVYSVTAWKSESKGYLTVIIRCTSLDKSPETEIKILIFFFLKESGPCCQASLYQSGHQSMS